MTCLLDEHDTTKTFPMCEHRNKPTNRRYICRHCWFVVHRDSVGSWNIRGK
ncbi:MAG: zinc ribbon domain-containing protein [Acidimicrobiales bacterium]